MPKAEIFSLPGGVESEILAGGELGLGPGFRQVHSAGILTPQPGVPNHRHVSGLRISGQLQIGQTDL
jgi:hypothetical protein